MANNFEEIIRIVLKLQGREAADQMREALRGLSESAEDLKESGQGLLDDIANTAKAQAAVAGIRDVGANVLQLSRDLGPARDKVAALYAEIQAAEKPTQRQQKAFEDSRKSLRNLEAAYDAQRAKLGEYRATIEAQGLSITKLSAAEETLTERRRQALDALQAEAAAARAAREETERAAVAAAEQAKAEAAATAAAQESARAAEAKRKAVEAEAEAIRQIRIEADKQARATREQAEIDARATREQAKRTEEARRAKTELQQLAGAVRDLGAQSAEAGARAQVLYDQFVDAGNAQAAVVAFRDTGAEVRRLANELDTARASVGEMARAMAQAEAPTRQQAEALEKQRVALRQIEATYEAQRAKLRILRTELQAQGLATNNLVAAEKILATRRREAIAAINSEAVAEKAAREQAEALARAKIAEAIAMREAARQAAAAAAAAKKLAAESSAVGKSAGDVLTLGNAFGKVTALAGGVALALATLRVGDVFGDAVASARALEREFDGVRAVSGATAVEMEQFRSAAEFATERTKFGAVEAAQALGELARATGSAQTAIAALPATTALAQAANLDLAQSAQFIVTSLTQFGLAADQAGRVADVLSKAANSTTADVQGLALSLSYAAPLARQLGMDLEETTAVIGALADQGFRGERAGTALRNVFTQLADPASNFRIALLGAGIAGDDFITILEGLVKSGDAGKRALMSLDAEARPAILSLVNSGGQGLRQLRADLDAATGSVDETARVMGDNFDGAVSRFVNSLDAARRALVDPLLEPLKAQFDDAAVRVREFIKSADFSVLKQSVTDFVLSAAEALKRFLQEVDFNQLVNSIRDFATESRDLFRGIKEDAEVVAAGLRVAVDAISTLFNGLQTVLLGASAGIVSALQGVVGAVLAAARAVDDMLPAYAKQTEAIKELQRKYDALGAAAEDLWSRTLKNFLETGAAAQRLGSDVKQVADGMGAAAEGAQGLGEASQGASKGVEQLGNELGLLPDYGRDGADGVSLILGPMRDVARDSMLAAQHITRFDDAVQRVGGGPIQDLRNQLRAAQVEYAQLVLSAEQSPQALEAAKEKMMELERQLKKLEAGALGAADAQKLMETAAASLGLKGLDVLRSKATEATGALQVYIAKQREGVYSQEAVNEAFAVYAQRQLELANAAGASERARVLAELRVQAAITGNNAALDEMLQKYAALANTPPPPAPSSGPVKEYTTAMQAAGEATEKTAQATAKFSSDSSQLLANAAEAIKQTRAEFEAVGPAAAASFDEILLKLERVHTSIGAGAGFDTLAENLQIAAAETRQAVEDQRAQLQLMIGELSSYGNAAADAFGQAQPSVEQMTERMAVLREQLELGASDFQLLGDQDLGLLRQALDSASQRVDALADKARSAQDALVSMARASQDALDEAAGNVDDIEKRRHEEQLKRIDELAKQGGAEAQAAAELARKKAQEEHALRLRQIEERRQREIEADNEVANNRRRNEQQQSSSGGATGSQQQSNQQGQGSRTGGAMTTVNINFGRGSIQATGTAQNMREFLTELKRSAQMGGYGVA